MFQCQMKEFGIWYLVELKIYLVRIKLNRNENQHIVLFKLKIHLNLD